MSLQGVKALHMKRFHHSKRQCSSPYVAPAAADTLQAYSPVTITWDPACLGEDMEFIDIYLYDMSTTATAPVHRWSGVPVKDLSLQTQIASSWYNATGAGTENMRLQFVLSGDPAWATTLAVGPTFSVAWNGTLPAEETKGDEATANTRVSGGSESSGGLSGGGIAAAVAVPLLAIILALVGYLFWNRRKSKSSTKRWSSVVEKRMSQMSQAPSFSNAHARSGSGASYAFSENRNSFAANTSPLRQATFAAADSMREAGNRNSRVSFVAQTSPTKDRTVPRPDRAFPRVGKMNQSISSEKDIILSPLSPEQDSPSVFGNSDFGPIQSRHRAQKSSLGSSLRFEVKNIKLEEDDSCAGALGVINGTSRLSRLNPDAEEALDTNQVSGHARQPSDMSLKMPRLMRNSLSPDQALAAYSSGKDNLPTSTSPIKKTKLRNYFGTSPSPSQNSLASTGMNRDDNTGFHTPSDSIDDLSLAPTSAFRNPILARPESAYSQQSGYSFAQPGPGLGLHANSHINEEVLGNENRASVISNRMSAASSVNFYAH